MNQIAAGLLDVIILLVKKLGRLWLIVFCLAHLSLANAADDVWDGSGLNPPSGVWGVGSNWVDNSTPGNSDTATFNVGQTYTVVFGAAPPAIQNLTVSAGAVTFTSAAGAKTLSVNSGGGQDLIVTGGLLTLGTSGNPLHLTIGDDLRVRGGGLLVSNFGSDVSTVDLFLGDSTAPAGNGTFIVDGAGSSLAVSGTAQLGSGGQTGLLIVRNGATADFNGTLGLADASSSHFSNGVLSVESGATLTTANIRIGTNAINGQTGTFSVGSTVGTSSVSQQVDATLVVGATLGGPTPNAGTLNINSGGVFNSGGGIGDIRIQPTGTINIAQGGVLHANGDFIIKGGVLEQTSTSVNVFNLAAGKTMTISNGGRASFAENPGTTTNGTYNITGPGSRLETTGALASFSINRGAAVNVSGGGLLSSARAIDIGATLGGTGNGTLSVDGIGSSAVASTSSVWGDFGDTANVSFTNNATGTFGAIFMAFGNDAGTAANVNVLSGADVTTGSLLLATVGGLTTSATLNVQASGSTLIQTGTSTLTVGEFSGSAAINIGTTLSGAAFTSGTGTATIKQTGVVTIGNGANTGTLNANGNVIIDGGLLQRKNAGSSFNLASSKTVTIQNAGRLSVTGDYTTAIGDTYNVNGSGSKFETLTGATFINNAAAVNVNAGGLVSSQHAINIGTDDNGKLTVDGNGSSATTVFASIWAENGGTANVNFSNNATGAIGDLDLARGTTSGTTASVNVLSGADVTVGLLSLARDGGATTAATLNVQGSGSTVTQASNVLIVGHGTSGTAAINIGTTASGAVFTTSSTGFTTINKTGTITIGGGGNVGTFVANGNVTINGGVLVQNSDSLFELAAGRTMTVQSGGRATLSNGYTTANSAVYNVSGPNSKLEVSGGILAPMRINNGAQVNVSSGGLVSSSCFVDVGTSGNGTMLVDGSGSSVFSSINADTFWGTNGSAASVTFSNNAIGTFNGGIEFANATTAGTAANVNVVSGAGLTMGSLSMAASGGATTSATLNVNGTGSTITQFGASTLTIGHTSTGTAAINIGTMNTGGTFATGAGAINVRTTGTITIGSGGNSGTLNANGNVTVSGGTINLAAGTLNANTITLSSGNFNFTGGTLHVATFNGNLIQAGGALAPGNSPGTTTIDGNYAINAGTLAIEIGGLAQGSQFDFVDVNGSATLAGTLGVTLINSFAPAAGNSFDVLDWNSLSGAFATLQLPALNAGLMWNSSRLYTAGILSVTIIGDYNANGIVDAADYVVWRKLLGQAGTGLAADGNGNNQVDSGDYDVWRAHFGQTSGSGSGTSVNISVPEPSILLMLSMFAAAGWCFPRSRAAETYHQVINA